MVFVDERVLHNDSPGLNRPGRLWLRGAPTVLGIAQRHSILRRVSPPLPSRATAHRC